MTAVSRPAVAFGAAACVLVGTVAVAVAVFAGPAPDLGGYVSEAGASGSSTVWPYRIGLLAVAAGQVLLGAALPRWLRLASGLLLASAVATALSAGVSCRAQCPLPPFDRVTLADLVHGGASIAAVAGTVFAMLAVAGPPRDLFPFPAPRGVAGTRPVGGPPPLDDAVGTGRSAPALRRLSVVAAAVALPLSAVAGLALLLVGRGVLTGAVERLLLLDLAVWGVAAGLILGLAREPAASRAPAAPSGRAGGGPPERYPG
ncbi:DUF998 domain-containing protein [Micromonospora sp. WMMD1102]|uniref:DUF998 domain-containing protein n=1 Tax=Micromonospora sp. WMMD1102 TaxID=3016105 RepID=UPI0024153DD6|nr:DUF998 domain-containing protein [Micromonospora sp. WMMD1102]MDG4785649.1 DUF998 domain-containing protein [Micromonospora sp. WMMD1102]